MINLLKWLGLEGRVTDSPKPTPEKSGIDFKKLPRWEDKPAGVTSYPRTHEQVRAHKQGDPGVIYTREMDFDPFTGALNELAAENDYYNAKEELPEGSTIIGVDVNHGETQTEEGKDEN